MSNIVPRSCISFTEQSKYIANYIMENYNNFIKNIGLNELSVYQESGSQIEYTNEQADQLKNSIKELHENNLLAIQESKDNALDHFKSLLESIEYDASLENIDENTTICKVHEFFDFSKINFADNAKKYFNNLYEGNDMNVFESISGLNAESIEEMNNKLSKELLGNQIEINKSFLQEYADSFISILNSDKITNAIIESYNKEYDVITSFIEMVENSPESSLDSICSINKKICVAEAVMNNCYSTLLDVYNRMINEYRNIFIKADVLNEASIIRSRKAMLGHRHRKMLGADNKDLIKINKAQIKKKKKIDQLKQQIANV